MRNKGLLNLLRPPLRVSIIRLLSAAILAAMLVPALAQASCTSPNGIAGDQIFNTSINTMQYCNDTNWVNVWASSETPIGTSLTAGDYCTTDGTNINCTTATFPVASGGTGNTSPAAHRVMLGEGTAAVGSAAAGTANYVLQANGASSDPSFTATLTGLTLSGGTLTGTTTLPGSSIITSSGTIGIATATPLSALQVQNGELQVGSSGTACTSSNAGALRYANSRLQYCNGTSWVYVH